MEWKTELNFNNLKTLVDLFISTNRVFVCARERKATQSLEALSLFLLHHIELH